MKFFNDVKSEFAKISWPSKSELKDSTAITIGLTAVFTLYIWGADNIISVILQMFYGLN